MLPRFVSAKDEDFHAKEIDGNFRGREPRETDCVFFRRYNHVHVAAQAAIDKALQFAFGITVMVSEALRQFDLGAEFAQAVLKTFRRGDATERADVGVVEAAERDLLPGVDVLKIERLVRALDDFSGA